MLYFAYASNLNQQQMLQRCPDSKPMFTAILDNYKLIFAGWSRKWRGGVASIKPFRGERVLGAVYEISDKDLKSLDRNEGYPDVYNRQSIMVRKEDGGAVEAITYIKVDQSEETKPSPDYVSIIRQGYRDWEMV